MSSAAFVAELSLVDVDVEGQAERAIASASVLRRLLGEDVAVRDEADGEAEEDGETDRSCCSRSFSRSPLRMYLFGGGAAAALKVLADAVEVATSAALRLLAISALRKSILAARLSVKMV